jgi:tetratricopeptide (TPR) repeat protein
MLGLASAQGQPRARRGAPPAEKSDPAEAKPDPNKPDPSQPAGRAKILDDLFGKLAKATDDREAREISRSIERMWLRSGSDTADLLMSRAIQAMQGKDNMLAAELCDRIIEMQDDWAEAFNKRATARFQMEDYNGAMQDIARALKLEPRHFGALAGMGFILQKTQQEKLAIRAFRRALELNPKQEELKKALEKLEPEFDGQNI